MENGEWENNLKGVRKVLYRLPTLARLRDDPKKDKRIVFIVEGEKDVETLEKNGLIATCNPFGAGKWRDEHSENLRGLCCVILPDNDDPGKAHGLTVAGSILGKAKNVQIIELPGLEEKGDVTDWFKQGNTTGDLLKLVDSSPFYEPEPTTDQLSEIKSEFLPEQSGNKDSKKKQTDVLLEIAEQLVLFKTPNEDCFAVVPVGSHLEILNIKSKQFRSWILRKFFEIEGQMPTSQSTSDVIENLRGRALFGSETHETFVRVAELDGNIFIDLVNAEWEVLKVNQNGWEILSSENSPIKFRRTRGMLPLPKPGSEGDIYELKQFVNVEENDFILVLAWLVFCFNPNHPFPILALNGEHGSAKSTSMEVLRSLIDPNKSTLRSLPKTGRDLAISANNAYVLSFDNLSGMPAEISDSLCRLATGGGLATRELFTDSDEIIFNARRPIIFNGIEEIATRPDLLDRSIILNSPMISEENRKTRAEFDREFEEKREIIFTGIINKLIEGLKNLPSVELDKKPRMADFAAFGKASFGEDFLNRYLSLRDESDDIALDASPIGNLIVQLMRGNSRWEGTASRLLTTIESIATEREKSYKYFPRQPNHFSNMLKRITPNLRNKGIIVSRGSGAKRREIILERINK